MLKTIEMRECRASERRDGARRGLRRAAALALATVTAATAVGAPRTAHAEEVSPTGKGIAGGALVGAELVVFGEAIFGVRSTSAYLIGAGAGAVAGGVGGYFLEQGVDDGRIPAYVLAGGLALLIPAIVVTLDATRFRPTEGAREDRPQDLPPSDPGKPGGSSVLGAEPAAPAPAPATPPATPAPEPAPAPAPAPTPEGGGGGGGTQAPTSLFDVHTGTLRLGVPVPEVRPVFSVAERKAYGVQNAGSELRFPVVRVTF